MTPTGRQWLELARTAVLATGALLLGFGVVIVLVPSIDPLAWIGASDEAFGNVVYAGFVIIALTGALMIGTLQFLAYGEQSPVPTPEAIPWTPTLGERFDRLTGSARPWNWPALTTELRQKIRHRLRKTTIDTVARLEECSQEQARKRVESGAWTTDENVATFLRESTTSAPELVAGLSNRWRFRRTARRTAKAIARLGEEATTATEVEREADTDRRSSGGRDWGERQDQLLRGNTPAGRPERTGQPGARTNQTTDCDQPTEIRHTHRWIGALAVGLLAGTAGLATAQPIVFLAGAVGLGFASYGHLTSLPPLDEALVFERTIESDASTRGDPVSVTLTVSNISDHLFPDVRLIDGVPLFLTVAEGTARRATVLQPGASVSITYAVRAEHGTHQFHSPTVIARDVSGATEVKTTPPEAPDAAVDTEMHCPIEVGELPIREQAGSISGRGAAALGTGVEFDRTREYRRGDPMDRIDWKRLARTGDLTTVELREDRATSIVICVDARAVAHRSRRADEPHGAFYDIALGEALVSTLLGPSTRERVGVAILGRKQEQGFDWLPPATGEKQCARALDLLLSHPALSSSLSAPDLIDDPAGSQPDPQFRQFEQRLPTDAQVVLVTPLSDTAIVQSAIRLEGSGYAPTVLSANVTPRSDSAGDQLARLERTNRFHGLRQAGVPVVDWNPEEPFTAACDRIEQGQWETIQ